MPDIFIWMLVGSKRVAYAQLPAEQIIYTDENVARGSECGECINLFMKNIEDESDSPDYNACKVEIFLWMGNVRYIEACWSAIPPGYELNHQLNLDTFPRFFKYNESSVLHFCFFLFRIYVIFYVPEFTIFIFTFYKPLTQIFVINKKKIYIPLIQIFII